MKWLAILLLLSPFSYGQLANTVADLPCASGRVNASVTPCTYATSGGITTTDHLHYSGTVMQTVKPTVANGGLSPTGTVWTPANGTALQNALSNFQPGDTIQLNPAVTYTAPTGNGFCIGSVSYNPNCTHSIASNPNGYWLLITTTGTIHPAGTRVFTGDPNNWGVPLSSEKTTYEPQLGHIQAFHRETSGNAVLSLLSYGVAKIWFEGVEFTPDSSDDCQYNSGVNPVSNVHDCYTNAIIYVLNTASAAPASELVFSHVYIHGFDGIGTDVTNTNNDGTCPAIPGTPSCNRQDVTVGIDIGYNVATGTFDPANDVQNVAVIDSVFDQMHSGVQNIIDGAGVGTVTSTGPFKIVNNYMSTSGEVVTFGGGGCIQGNGCATIPPVPSDAEIQFNSFHPDEQNWLIAQDYTWMQGNLRWGVKNAFETKDSNRILLNGNIIGPAWAFDVAPDGSGGYGTSEKGQCARINVRTIQAAGSVTLNTTITNNYCVANQGFQLVGADNYCTESSLPSQQANCKLSYQTSGYPQLTYGMGRIDKLYIYNNILLERDQGTVATMKPGANGNVKVSNSNTFPQISAGISNLAFIHNTYYTQSLLTSGQGLYGSGTQSPGDNMATWITVGQGPGGNYLNLNYPVSYINNGGSGYVVGDKVQVNAIGCTVNGPTTYYPILYVAAVTSGAVTQYVGDGSNGTGSSSGSNCYSPQSTSLVTQTAVTTTALTGSGSGLTVDVQMVPFPNNHWIYENVSGAEPLVSAASAGGGSLTALPFSLPGPMLYPNTPPNDVACRFSGNVIYIAPGRTNNGGWPGVNTVTTTAPAFVNPLANSPGSSNFQLSPTTTPGGTCSDGVPSGYNDTGGVFSSAMSNALTGGTTSLPPPIGLSAITSGTRITPGTQIH